MVSSADGPTNSQVGVLPKQLTYSPLSSGNWFLVICMSTNRTSIGHQDNFLYLHFCNLKPNNFHQDCLQSSDSHNVHKLTWLSWTDSGLIKNNISRRVVDHLPFPNSLRINNNQDNHSKVLRNIGIQLSNQQLIQTQ